MTTTWTKEELLSGQTPISYNEAGVTYNDINYNYNGKIYPQWDTDDRNTTTWSNEAIVPSLIDSYSESNYIANFFLMPSQFTDYQYFGQSFTTTGQTILDSCVFYLSKLLSPTGNITAQIWSYDTDTNKPVALLASSDTIDSSTLTTTMQPYTFSFLGVNRILLSASTTYYLVVNFSGTWNNCIKVATDVSSPTHSGYSVDSVDGSTWATPVTTRDAIFYVYGLALTTWTKELQNA